MQASEIKTVLASIDDDYYKIKKCRLAHLSNTTIEYLLNCKEFNRAELLKYSEICRQRSKDEKSIILSVNKQFLKFTEE